MDLRSRRQIEPPRFTRPPTQSQHEKAHEHKTPTLTQTLYAGFTQRTHRSLLHRITQKPIDESVIDATHECITVLLSLYNDYTRAQTWINALHEKARDNRRHREAVKALQLYLNTSQFAINSQKHLYRHISWKETTNHPWTSYIHTTFLLKSGNHTTLRGWLKRFSSPQAKTPSSTGARLRLLGEHTIHLGYYNQAARTLRRAKELLWQEADPPALCRFYLCLYALAKAIALSGKPEKALHIATEATTATKFLPEKGAIALARRDLAVTFKECGLVNKAERITRGLTSLTNAPTKLVAQLQALTEIQLDQGRTPAARTSLERAWWHLSRRPHERWTGYLLATGARLEAEDDTNYISTDVLRDLYRAELIFRRLGSAGRNGLAKVIVTRGEVYRRFGEPAAALQCAREALDLTSNNGLLPQRGRTVLLLSRLLPALHHSQSRQVYEQVLVELGNVRNPLLLFHTIANLYLYSWDLGPRLDITDRHLRDLEALKPMLEPEVWHRLFDKHVTRRVFARWIRPRPD